MYGFNFKQNDVFVRKSARSGKFSPVGFKDSQLESNG